jgi:hypothetical protein
MGSIVKTLGSNSGLFYKTNNQAVAWAKTGNFTLSTATTLQLELNSIIITIASGTSITMVDAATTGRDYYIYLRTDGTLGAYLDSTTAPSSGRLVGGFHYAPGGNATAQSGGDTTPSINAYSFWDLKWKPSCKDPRGMALVAGKFWADIYLLNRSAYASTSAPSSVYNSLIADGETSSSTTPLIPAEFGGNGTTRYVLANWWNMAECLGSFGKRHPTNQEFIMLAYGTTEESSGGADPVSTILRQAYTSKWGIMLATGNLWVWAQEWNSSGDTLTADWSDLDTSVARGQVYQDTNAAVRAAILGGAWHAASFSGSRASGWDLAPSSSFNLVSARGVCDHLTLI